MDAGSRRTDAEIGHSGSVAVQKALIIVGIAIVLVGVGWPWISKLPLGRLPGDIVINRENFRLYFPLTTMILVSLLLSAIIWLVRK